MEGEGKIAVTDRRETNAANGVVMVKRVAAKVTVKIKAEESVTIGGTEWKSQPDEINIHFYNGVKNSLISSDPDDNTTPAYFDLDITATRLFYSYPIRWNVGDESEPYFRIMLPWTHAVIEDGTTKWEKKPTYYKVILGGEILERNTWSDVTIRLSAPGNFEDFPDYNVDIDDIEYRVVDWSVADVEWNVGLNVDTEILESRYLVVDNDRHVLNNQDTLRIPYTSSHECEVIDKKIKRPNFKSQDGVKDEEIVWNDNWHIDLKQTTEETYIEFVHKLNNDIKSKQIDFAPYTITFRVRHKDADGQSLYYRDVTIIQNPAMMISVEKNEGGNIVEDPKTTKSDDKGYVFVNGNQMHGGDYHWDIVRSCLDGGNSNPNMYVISTTIPFEEYILTDPRKPKRTTVTTLNFPSSGNTNTTKVAVDANGKTLQYYYETINGDESLQIIAPKFRIASSYGKCLNSINKENARRRCAAYQEQGYPAGRWRVPTHAELKFIATLSNYKIIPELFTPGNKYWTSAGVIYYGDDLKITTQTSGAVRCVYDEWYWEQTETPKVDKTKFTWGDEPR